MLSLFHHGLIKILLVSHLSRISENWESFLSRNGFNQVDDTINPHLIVNPNLDRPMTESQAFNSLDGSEVNEPTSIVDETIVDKKFPCMFSPRKSLEQVISELKGKYHPMPINESNLNNNGKLVVKKFCKGKKQQSSDLNFSNKKAGRLISRNLIN
jgi:hypothetical protein